MVPKVLTVLVLMVLTVRIVPVLCAQTPGPLATDGVIRGQVVIATVDLEQGEWFDPAVLQALLPSATAVTIAGVEKKPLDLIIR